MASDEEMGSEFSDMSPMESPLVSRGVHRPGLFSGGGGGEVRTPASARSDAHSALTLPSVVRDSGRWGARDEDSEVC
jgi:hypothetical protein